MALVLLFRLARTRYALPVERLREIVPVTEFAYLPLAGGNYLGAINVHGSILPVLDLPRQLGFASAERDGRVIVLASELGALALAVNAVERIVPLPEEALLAPAAAAAAGSRLAFCHEEEPLHLLDTEQLLTELAAEGQHQVKGRRQGQAADD